jgi:hypothetical protein
MKRLILLPILFLVGCSTPVPVRQPFPAAPDVLMQKCDSLLVLNDNENRLSRVIESVTKNYAKYHECKARNDAWIEWYNTQKKIFEEVQ